MSKYLRNIYDRMISLSVMKKVIFMVMGVILLMSTASILFTTTIVNGQLIEDLERRAHSIGSDVASRSSEALLTDDIVSIYQMMNDTMSNHPDLAYIFIVDEQGNVIVDSFGADLRVSEKLLNLHEFNQVMNQGNLMQVFESSEGTIHDVLAPIRDGDDGYVRIGLNEDQIDETIASLTLTIMLITIVMAGVGLLVAYLLTRILYRQIMKLVDASKAIAGGFYSHQIVIHSSDELGLLAESYNDMSNSLHQKDTENSRLMKDLKEKEEIREKLLKKVITAQEEERKRIARELHDETSQTITSMIAGLKVVSEQYDPDHKAQKKLKEIRGIAQHTLDEIHYISWSLRPSVLDHLGLLSAVERYIGEFSSKFNIDVDIHHQNISNKRLRSEIEITIYRVIQEALTNVARHSKAREVGIVLLVKNEELQLIIEDDGIGFDPGNHQGSPLNHLGLKGMQERVEDLGGTMIIESKDGQGTTIYINHIRLNREEHRNDKTLTG